MERTALEPPVVTYDPLVASSLERITETTARDLVAGWTGEQPITVDGQRYILARPRYPDFPPEMATALEHAREQLDRRGLTRGPADANAIGIREGEVRPSEIILVVAHFDAHDHSLMGWPSSGADDNTSGSAAVMLAAEAVGRHQFERTIRFILFRAEGSYSAEYASRMVENGENVVAVINLDLVGRDTGKRRAHIFVGYPRNPTHGDETTIAQTYVDVAQTYLLNLSPFVVDQDG